MSYLQSFILGLIQGLTEFLPVSSSGHLLLFSELLGVTPSLGYELVLHLATLFAVVIFYFKTILERLKKPFQKDNWFIVISTAITAVFAVFMRKIVGKFLFTTTTLPMFFLLTAVILIVGSVLKNGNKKLTFGKSAVIGIAQGLACIPGLSRSGTTISTALILGVEKDEATTFSFLLSIPIILGSLIIELISEPIVNIELGVMAVGFITAFISGFIALKIVSALMKKASLDVFAVYLVALSLVMLIAG